MAFDGPGTLREFVTELVGEAKRLRRRATSLRISAAPKPCVEGRGTRREDLCEARLKVADALIAAAELLENRAFADFGEEAAEEAFALLKLREKRATKARQALGLTGRYHP